MAAGRPPSSLPGPDTAKRHKGSRMLGPFGLSCRTLLPRRHPSPEGGLELLEPPQPLPQLLLTRPPLLHPWAEAGGWVASWAEAGGWVVGRGRWVASWAEAGGRVASWAEAGGWVASWAEAGGWVVGRGRWVGRGQRQVGCFVGRGRWVASWAEAGGLLRGQRARCCGTPRQAPD